MTIVRAFLIVLLAAVGVAAWTQIPGVPSIDTGLTSDRPAVSSAGCPVVTGPNATSELSIGSPVSATAPVRAVAGGTVFEDRVIEVNDAGGAEFDFGSGSTIAVVADLPDSAAAMAVVTKSENILAVAQCTSPVDADLIVAGTSTASGETLDLIIANPYANDALVEVRTSSEAGPDSASQLESVVIRARSVATIDLANLLSLRGQISARVIADRGVVHVVAVQSSTEDRMVMEGVAPSREWYLPVPDTGTAPRVTIATASPVEVAYRIDTFGPAGTVEAVKSGTVPPDQHVEIDTAELGDGITGLRVSTDGEVVASVVILSDSIRAGTPGVPMLSDSWLVPGASGEGAVVRLLNPSGLAVDAVLQALIPGGQAQSVTIEPGSTIEVPVDGPGAGYSVRADGEIMVAWSISSDGGFGLAVGTPNAIRGE